MADLQQSGLPVSQRPRSVMALFGGDDTDTMPLWFNKNAFTASDFSSESYIADLRKFVPLETLRAELRSHLRLLKGELVELINRDYADFVNLSTKLVDVDGAVLRMRAPLSDLRSRLSSVKDSVKASLSALQDGLHRRADASHAREILELLLDTSHVVSKIEKLLAELKRMPEDSSSTSQSSKIVGMQPLSNGSVDDSAESVVSLEESRSRLLERIASEMNRLNFYVARIQDLPFVQNMENRIQSARMSLDASLRESFEVGLRQRNEAVIFRCLRGYAAIDNTQGAHEVFRLFVVSPIMEKVFLKETDAGPSDYLEDDFNEIKRHIEVDCKFLLDITIAANSGVQAFDFLGSSILKELHTSIQKNKPGAFSPGKPSIFLANYKASMNFLDHLEGYCQSKSAISTFRSQPAYLDFLKQWNLGVYFTLRFQEVAGDLDGALSATNLGRIADHSLGLALSPSAALERCLLKCWQPDVFVLSLSDKFLGLALQLMSRYSTWLLAGLEARQSGNNTNGMEWALGSSPEDLVLVKHDVELLSRMVKGTYLESIRNVFHSAPKEVLAAIEDSIQEGADKLIHVVPHITEALSDVFVKRSIEVLTQLKGITTTFRMTNKPLPVRHSSYVSGILHSIKAFLDGEYASYLSSEERLQFVAGIGERVTSRFHELAKELVTVTKKMESSLLRFRQGVQRVGTAGADSGESNISDTDKICKQLYLDVQEYGRRLRSIGVKAEELPVYIMLWQCVAPEAEKQGPIVL
ncbi:hypothetical protein GOP47_0004195 [Adiantum capillus-veneris]|uniref:Conserved oligomeric Golgi complex subunit 2 n=1 Tax=Adiantum capillus-veneris TaxID=13818 RepID=A0A9D4V8U4_ADICA|nr:hypothetical protein GOP47_0004195 [Adiantum capillus-veneris]